MALPDLINGLFEFGGSITGFMNCWRLYKDKEVKGVVWQFNVFYISWGLWNMYYYPHLDQWLSFTGGCFIVLSNIIWVSQVLHYLKFWRRAGQLPARIHAYAKNFF